MQPEQPAPRQKRKFTSEDYKEFLRSAEWEELREKVKERAGYKCERCGGNNGPLQVHHLTYKNKELYDPFSPYPPSWLCPPRYLICLDEACHRWAHSAGPDPTVTPTWKQLAERFAKL